jgi:aminopeptidase YwaD
MAFRRLRVCVAAAVAMGLAIVGVRGESLESQHWPVLSINQLQGLIDTISGETALDHIRYISQYWRWAPSQGFHEVAEYVVKQAKSYGLEDAHIERFIADKTTTYLGAPLYRPSWDSRAGELWVEEPVREKITSFADIPVCIAGYSRNTDVTAELINVGDGTHEDDYAGKDIKGKIVLGTAGVGELQQMAVFERGALGVLSAWTPEYQTSRTAMDYPDSVTWGTGVVPESKTGQPSTFGFMLSERQRHELLALLRTHKKVIMHATVRADWQEPGYLEVVTATIPGSEFPDQEIDFIGHLEHPKPSANDNTSGSATFLEIARSLEVLIHSGQLPQPKRTIRFLWVQEGRSPRAYVDRHPEVAKRVFAGINMDMVGEDEQKTKGILMFSTAPASRPSFVSDVVQDFFEMVRNINNDRGPTEPLHQILAPTGQRRPFLGDVARFQFGSDEWSFLIVGVPGLSFTSWPDEYHHTQYDTPDKVDPTQMKRVAFIGSAAAAALTLAGPNDAIPITSGVVGRARARLGEDLDKALHLLDRATAENLQDFYKEARNVVHQGYIREHLELDSIHLLTGNNQNAVDYLSQQEQVLAESEPQPLKQVQLYYEAQAKRLAVRPQPVNPTEADLRADKLIPAWADGVRGMDANALVAHGLRKLKIFSYTWQSESAINPYNATLFETLNFVDGKRSIKEVRDAVSAEYNPVPLDVVEELMNAMASSGLVQIRAVGSERHSAAASHPGSQPGT